MDSRREFIRKAALLSGGIGLTNSLPLSIQKALSIDPIKGSTYLDAEHVVILMQENRSFDHCYGMLQGVRGYNDPRAIVQPNKNPVWLQTNATGETYGPSHLDIKNTKITFLGSLPHSWPDQVDANNKGKHDQWLQSKASGHKGFEQAPLTMGYYKREDLPFYYSLADAFTVCDQNFCSSLTGTTPNRLYLWTGTIRREQHGNAPAHVMNGDTDYEKEVSWKTFPERLEENGVSWKIYQNEISLESGLTEDEDNWLANFTDNPIEWFSQYNVRHAASYTKYMEKMEAILPSQIIDLEGKIKLGGFKEEEGKRLNRELANKKSLLQRAKDRHRWSKENFEKLSTLQKNLHKKAFAINDADPDYRKLTLLKYNDEGTEREMIIPKGDPLFQFRKDVKEGKLPAVSWVVGSANFSDHPGSPWYGAWYVSEVMDILTSNPEVWKKTIFILCYDENDGYFDHVPPFVAPNPNKPETGKVSSVIDASMEFIPLEQDLKMRSNKSARESSIGLGFRVPLVIASPWSRGGVVNSQVFDHTSILQFLEHFLSNKTGKSIKETNISMWRRAVCGDLSSVFKPYNGEKINLPSFLEKESFYESIHKAQFKKDPSGFIQFSKADIDNLKASGNSTMLPKQEKGTRAASSLPYELSADGKMNADKTFQISFASSKNIFGNKSAGAPFKVYAYGSKGLQVRDYALIAGDKLQDSWLLEDNLYNFKVYGPNGFFRGFEGSVRDPLIETKLIHQKNGNLQLQISNNGAEEFKIQIADKYHKNRDVIKVIGRAANAVVDIDTSKSASWYDLILTVWGHDNFQQHFAGKVETEKWTTTDPAMGE